MSRLRAYPIFFDVQQRRMRYSQRILLFVVILLLTVFGVMIGSFYVVPVLPQISLGLPIIPARGASNIATARSSALSIVPFNSVLFNAQAAARQQVPSSASPVTQASTKVLAYYVNWDDNSLTSLKANIQGIDVLIPEWLHLADDSGVLMQDDPGRQAETLQFIHSRRPNLPIVPLINNFNSDIQDWDDERVGGVLADASSRGDLIRNILFYLQQNYFQGVSIDFENVPENQISNLTIFMKELYNTLHPLGLQVSQNIPLQDPLFKPRILGQYVDYLILMAYDEHTVYDSVAGPIASLGWVTQGLQNRLKELPAEKYVVALGGYGYNWEGSSTTGTEMTYEESLRTAQKNNATVRFDAATLHPTYTYVDQNVTHTVWFLDALSIFDQILATQTLGTPMGYALWRLGSEDPTVWSVLTQRNKLDQAAAQSLAVMNYGYDVSYEGTGEVMRVTARSQTGLRQVGYDPVSGYIISESIDTFPSPYVITRWGGRDPQKIALTFDDGPDQVYTPTILDILKSHGVHGTFFVIGASAVAHPEIITRMANEGNEIGNHTFSHPNISSISNSQFRLELDSTERLIEATLHKKTLLFRPPYAEDIEPVVPEQVQPLLFTSALGYYVVGMHIDPRDWATSSGESVVNAVMEGARLHAGNVVLLHDGGGDRAATVAALPKIIETLQNEGFQLVTISDLVGLSSNQLMPPISNTEQAVADINGVGFLFLSGFNRFLLTMFIVGISLGSVRFLVVGVLAIVQWLHVRIYLFRTRTQRYTPRVAVVVPILNEARVIFKTVQALLASRYTDMRIIVVDDGSTDESYQLLRKAFGTHPRITLLTQENRGKAQALNFGILHTTPEDEIIVTLDADTLFLPDTIEKLARRFGDHRVGAVAGNAKVGNRINLLTRWQALEYIVSQNLDRRAFELLNCISVVPGSVGAWRRTALLKVGKFSDETLAEDADLTFEMLRSGYRVVYEERALGYTEAPDTVRGFVNQRFRWMFGTLQVAWKNRDTFGRFRYGSLGFFALPNIFIFQLMFPLISPLMDAALILSLVWAGWQKYHHPLDFSVSSSLSSMIEFYLFFLVLDLATAVIPFFLEYREQKSLIFWLPLQRFFYRQLLYYVALKVVIRAVQGQLGRWGQVERKGTVQVPV